MSSRQNRSALGASSRAWAPRRAPSLGSEGGVTGTGKVWSGQEQGSLMSGGVRAAPSKGKGRRARRRPLRGRTLLLLLILAYCLVLSLRSEWQIYRLKKELAQAEVTRQELLLKRQALEREKQRLNDPAYLEGVVREELGLVRPGEVLVVPGDRLAP